MKVGDYVRYAQNDDGLIYEIVELNGDRGFMQPLNWKYGFAPTILFRVADVVAA